MGINTKFMAVLAAFMMVAVAGIVVVQSSDESDAAAGEAGYMNVYINSGNGWSVQTVLAANGCEAVKATTVYNSHNGDVIDDAYTYEYEYQGNWYTDINSNYGKITQLNGTPASGTSTWNVLVYVPVQDPIFPIYNNQWVVPTAELGYYKPFADYASIMMDYGTANIAVWYGDSSNASAMIGSLTSYASSPRALTQIDTTTGSVYEHVFYLKNTTNFTMAINGTNNVTIYDPSTGTYAKNQTLTNADITAGVYVVGYGSDAELALMNALNVPGQTTDVIFGTTTNPVPGYLAYGWLDTIFGLGTVSQSGHYYYWSTYTAYDEVNSYYAWAGFVVGAYSALTNAPLVDGTIALVYEYS